ncbi:MAG: ABC transporter ATP-binding protein [Hyphomicrobiaceae bacterium]
MADVELTSVTKSWAGKAAVDAVSFRAASGSFVALLGPSGCGKSTTLRLIAGLDTPSGGTIRIGGRDVTALPPAERGVAMVFQSYALFPHLSVAENILFGLKVRKVAADEQKRRLDRAAEMLGLGALLDRKPSQLSGGQQQRAALGRAIVAEAPVCLMDEPLSNLDAQLRVEMRREIRELQQRLKITMLYVTHDQLEAMTMADQVVLMNDGRVEQDASPAELYERPTTVFAARFIGTPPMNVTPIADLATAAADVTAQAPTTVAPDKLALGIRPELIRIGDTGIPARISAIEYLGADSLIETAVGNSKIQVRVAGKSLAKSGDSIMLSWENAAAHWFDLSSGRRLA